MIVRSAPVPGSCVGPFPRAAKLKFDWNPGLCAEKFFSERVCASLNLMSKFALNWFSRKREMAEIGVKPDGVAADGIAKAPLANLAFRIVTAIGFGTRPNVDCNAAALRLLSRNWGGMTGNSKLLLSDAPFVSRVPWYEPKKNNRSRRSGPPSVPPN